MGQRHSQYFTHETTAGRGVSREGRFEYSNQEFKELFSITSTGQFLLNYYLRMILSSFLLFYFLSSIHQIFDRTHLTIMTYIKSSQDTIGQLLTCLHNFKTNDNEISECHKETDNISTNVQIRFEHRFHSTNEYLKLFM